MADCSKLERRQPGKLGRRTSTAAYGAQPKMVMRPNVVDVDLDVCRLAEVVGKVRNRYTLETLVNKKGELIVNQFRCFKPMQLAVERGDVVIP